MEFKRHQLVENINTLIQQKNMKVGEVEQAIGISTGYISRLSKAGSESIPATDVVWKLARHLGVSTDALISGDFSDGTDNLSVLRRFIKKLTVRTMDGQLDWSPVTTQYVNAVLKGDEPLFFLVQEKEKNYGVPSDPQEEGFSEVNRTHAFYVNRRIVSAASPLDFAWLTGDGFKAKLSDTRQLYLFPMCLTFDTGTPAGSIEQDYFEMYMLDWKPDTSFAAAAAVLTGQNTGRWVATQVYDTFKSSMTLGEESRDLYNIANQTAYDVKINTGVRNAIMDFLNDDSFETAEDGE